MAVDIDEGDAATVPIEGATCLYVLMESTGREMEVSIFHNAKEDLVELKTALRAALGQRRIIILLRADSRGGPLHGWQSLDPGVFVTRL